jgi:hypothetical protein
VIIRWIDDRHNLSRLDPFVISAPISTRQLAGASVLIGVPPLGGEGYSGRGRWYYRAR